MMLWAARVNMAVFAVFLALEVTEIVLSVGYFRIANGGSAYVLHAGGWIAIVTAAAAWYASAAGVVNSMSPREVLPVGRPLWGPLPVVVRQPAPPGARA